MYKKETLIALLLFAFCASPVASVASPARPQDDARPLIRDIKKTAGLPEGCGCFFSRKGGKRSVFVAAMTAFGYEMSGDRHAWMNLEGKDLRLNFVGSTQPARKLRKGERFVQTYRARDVLVHVTYVVAAPNPPGGEVTAYDAIIRATKGNRKQTIKASGYCGC